MVGPEAGPQAGTDYCRRSWPCNTELVRQIRPPGEAKKRIPTFVKLKSKDSFEEVKERPQDLIATTLLTGLFPKVVT